MFYCINCTAIKRQPENRRVMDSEVKTLSPSKEGPVKRKSPWGTPTQAPTPCSLAAVMDEELAMKLQHEEEHAFK